MAPREEQLLFSKTRELFAISTAQLANGHREPVRLHLEKCAKYLNLQGDQLSGEFVCCLRELQGRWNEANPAPKTLSGEQLGDLPNTETDERMLQALGLTGPAKQLEPRKAELSEPEIDIEMAERHLAALGIGPEVAVILCAYGQTNSFVPDRADFFTAAQKRLSWEQRQQIPWDWAAVETQQAKRLAEGLGRDWQRLRQELRNPATPNLGFIGGAGGTCTKGRGGEIVSMRFLTYEIDKRRDGTTPTADEQRQAWRNAGLPEPTLMVNTGGKSFHPYWVLSKSVPLAEGEVARQRLFRAIEDANPLLRCDYSMRSGHQPQRLAGFIHPKTGNRSVIETCDPSRTYDLQELLALLPEIPEEELHKAEGDGELFREDEEKAKPGERLALPIKDSRGRILAVPLTVALSHATQQLLAQGQQAGGIGRGSVGRCQRAHSICRSLQAAEAQLEHLGQPFTSTAEELYQQFVERSSIAEDYYNGDLEYACSRHWNDGAHGEGELSELALRRAIHACKRAKAAQLVSGAISSSGSTEQPKEAEPKGQVRGFAEVAAAVGAKWEKGKFSPRGNTAVRWGEVNLSLSRRLDHFDRVVGCLAGRVRNTLRRKARIRNAQAALKLNREVKEAEVQAKILEHLDERAGNVYQPLTAAQRKAMERPKVDWLLENLIPANDLTVIGGRAKVGKTRLVIGITKAILDGDDFLEFRNPELGRTVVLVTDDQSDGDTAQMLTEAGIWDHQRLIWSRRFRVTERNLDGLLKTIQENPGAVVVLDSLRSIIRGTGIDENSAEIGPLLYDLKQAVLDAGGTMLLIHHCNKGNDATGMEALSGHNSIPSAGNTVLTLHYISGWGEDRSTTLQKGKPERRLFREARSGIGCDLVILPSDGATYKVVDTFEAYLAKFSRAAATQDFTKTVCGDDEELQEILKVLLRVFKGGTAPGVSLLALLQEIGAVRKEAPRVRDLNAEENKLYKRLNRKMNDLAKAKRSGRASKEAQALLVAIPNTSNGEGRASMLYALTGDGAKVIAELIGE